jgi:hypothetical protein
MLKKLINPALLLILIVGLAPFHAWAETPEWLRAASRQTMKNYADHVDAVVLMQEDETRVSDKGEIVEHGRVVFRILRPEGRKYATFAIDYSNDTKVTSLRGWSVTAKGQEYEAKEKDAIEHNLSTYEIYSDAKEKILHVSGADVGSFVGFEFERKHRPFIFGDAWGFQGTIPTEHAKYTLRMPSGWEIDTHWVNYPDQKPSVQGEIYTWELTDIPAIELEYNQPPYQALAGRMTVSMISEKFKSQTYRNWSELGAWNAQLMAGVFDSSSPLQQKVTEIAPPSMPLLDRMKALSRFAQKDIRYAAIEIGIGGIKPHQASDVFTHRYGDCKDKAALLKTMLNQIGVKSYLMPISTERGVFNDKSPASMGFNHVILAIQLPDSVSRKDLSSIYVHPKLGDLLIFDPTSEYVPFGYLPYFEQDNYALLLTESGGELIHLPVSSPELNQIKRIAKLNLLPDGTLQGEVEETRSGFFASEGRGFEEASMQDRKKAIEHYLGRTVTNVQVDSFDLANVDKIDQDLVLRYKFTAGHYAKNAGALLLVRPRVMGEMAGAYDSSKPRHYAYEFEAPFIRSDEVQITLPDGFLVDELPEPAKASFGFGDYTSKTEKVGNTLKYTRQYRMQTTLVPLDKVGDLRKMFSQINLDEKNMAVLKKAN